MVKKSRSRFSNICTNHRRFDRQGHWASRCRLPRGSSRDWRHDDVTAECQHGALYICRKIRRSFFTNLAEHWALLFIFCCHLHREPRARRGWRKFRSSIIILLIVNLTYVVSCGIKLKLPIFAHRRKAVNMEWSISSRTLLKTSWTT